MNMKILVRSAALAILAVVLPIGAGAQARSASSAVDGLWCGTGLIREFSLQLAQHTQAVSGTIKRRDRVRELSGSMEGNIIRTQTTKIGALVLELQGDALRIVDGDGQLALARGLSFIRASGSTCS